MKDACIRMCLVQYTYVGKYVCRYVYTSHNIRTYVCMRVMGTVRVRVNNRTRPRRARHALLTNKYR